MVQHEDIDHTGIPGVGGAGGLTVTQVYKSADEVVNNSSALQNDNLLLFAIAASEVWNFETHIFWDGATNSDAKFAFTVPAAATIRIWHGQGTDASGGANSQDTTYTGSGTVCGDHTGQGVGTIRHMSVSGYVINGANAGNVQLQWAQVTAQNTDTTVRQGSWIRATKMA